MEERIVGNITWESLRKYLTIELAEGRKSPYHGLRRIHNVLTKTWNIDAETIYVPLNESHRCSLQNYNILLIDCCTVDDV